MYFSLSLSLSLNLVLKFVFVLFFEEILYDAENDVRKKSKQVKDFLHFPIIIIFNVFY